MTDPVTQGNTLTDLEELQWAVRELREELKLLESEFQQTEDRDKRTVLQDQIDGKQDVILLLEMEADMTGEFG